MSALPSPSLPLLMGIDGGGSKCKALLECGGAGVAGPANPFQDIEQAKRSIVAAATRALQDAGLPTTALDRVVAGVGLAGVNVPHYANLMDRWQHPFRAIFITTDIHIACLGAHGGSDGAVIVAGTGSVGYSQHRNARVSLGAHGFPFGDKGSGAWMGLEAMKAALLALDDLGPATALTDSIQRQLGVSGLAMIEVMATARQRDYGALAPLVFDGAEQGDAVSLAIVREGADYLDALARKLLATGAERFSLLGGLAPRIKPWLDPNIADRLVDPIAQPDTGALLFARSEYLRSADAQPAAV